MVDKIYNLKNEFISRIEHDLSERGIDRIDVKEMGELVDMVKDLAEAEDYCWQAEYYKSISKAMENESSGYGSGYSSGYGSGYGTSRSGYGGTGGRTGYGSMPKGHHDVVDPVRMAMQNATPDEREHLKNEIMTIIKGK